MALTMNYQGLQNLYSKPKKKKHSKTKKNKKGIDTKAKVKKAVKEAKNPLTSKEQYHQQLEHPLWYKKRKIILARDNHKCVLCGSTDNLQVHHMKYFKNRYAWEYANSTLVTLCRECHQKVHSDKNNELYPKYF